MQNNDIEDIPSKSLTDEERYYVEQFYKEPVESLKRIEETAKYLIGTSSATSGLYLAAFKMAFGEAKDHIVGLIPFICWSLAIILLILTLIPRKYDTGKNEPESYKKAFQAAHHYKSQRLMFGAVCFILGIITAAMRFVI